MEALFTDLPRGDICVKQLQDFSHSVFTEHDADTNVLVLESVGPKSSFKKTWLRSSLEIEDQIGSGDNGGIRLISISSKNSYSPLQIIKPGMEHVLQSVNVSPDFVNIIASMGRPPHEAEEGSGHVIENKEEDGSFNISYLSRYYGLKEWEDSGVVKSSWKLRQIGVYHSFSATEDCHTFIFLHPEPETVFQQNLLRLVGAGRKSSLVHARPMLLHAMLLSCYFDDWRRLIKDYGEQFLRDKENLVAQKLKDLKVEARFKRLQFWYDLEDRLAPLEPILVSIQNQLDTFQALDTFLTTVHDPRPVGINNGCYSVLPATWFSTRKRLVNNFLVSVAGLHKRTTAILHLIEITLELNNQRKLGSINRHILDLNEKNHVGAENIKVITIVTLFFLPASLVSSFFGMNFFNFNESTRNMTTASNTWIYAAATVPFFLIVVALWRFVVGYSTTKRGIKDEEDELSADED